MGLVLFAGAGVFAEVAAAANVHLVFGAGVGRLGIGCAACLDDEDVSLGLWERFFGDKDVAFAFEFYHFAPGFELGEESGCAIPGSCRLFLCVEKGDGGNALGANEQLGLIWCGAEKFAAVRAGFEFVRVRRGDGEEYSGDGGEECAGDAFMRWLHGCWFFRFL